MSLLSRRKAVCQLSLARPSRRLGTMRALLWSALAALGGSQAVGCSQATQTYALVVHPELRSLSHASDQQEAQAAGGAATSGVPAGGAGNDGMTHTVGSLSVERIEGGQNLVVLQLEQLPPPERIGTGLHTFVVWLEDPRGREVKMGTLRYDRAHRSGNLLATTELTAFTVRVTGERDGLSSEPSGVLLAERRVVTN